MDEVIAIAIIFGSVLSFLTLVALIQSRRSGQKWQKLADELGLSFEGGNILFRKSKIKGVYRKRKVLFEIYMENRALYTQLEIEFENKKNVSFSVYIKRAFEKMGDLLGEEIRIDQNPPFNSKMTVRANDEEIIRSVIDIPIQERILELGKFNIIRVKDKKAYFREVGIITDAERLKLVINLVSDIIDKIEND